MTEVLIVTAEEELDEGTMEQVRETYGEDVEIKYVNPSDYYGAARAKQMELAMKQIVIDEKQLKQKEERRKRMMPSLMATVALGAAGANGISMSGFCPISDTEPNVRHNPDFYAGREVGRNQPCPCGSGVKYKKCCMRKEPENV